MREESDCMHCKRFDACPRRIPMVRQWAAHERKDPLLRASAWARGLAQVGVLLMGLGLGLFWMGHPAASAVDDAVASLPLVAGAPPFNSWWDDGYQCLALDDSGNCYVTSRFGGTVDFNREAGLDVKDSGSLPPSSELYGYQPGGDAYVTCYRSNGAYGWTQTFGSDVGAIERGVAVANGTVYVVGAFNGKDAGIGGQGILASTSGKLYKGRYFGYEIFVMALDAATGAPKAGFGTGGIVMLGSGPSHQYNLSGSNSGVAVAVYEGTIYVTGYLLNPNGFTRRAFILALDASTGAKRMGFGNEGIQIFGGSGWAWGSGIAIQNGIVYVNGHFQGSNFGLGGSGGFSTVPSPISNNTDVFMLALDAETGQAKSAFGQNGVVLFSGTSHEFPKGLAISGNTLFAAGTFSGSIGFWGAGTVQNQGGDDTYVLALDASSGAPKASFGSGGIQTFGSQSQTAAVHWSGGGLWAQGDTVYVSGGFNGMGFGLGGTGTVNQISSRPDADTSAFLLALDATTGIYKSNFGNGGVRLFGGSLPPVYYGATEAGWSLAASPQRLVWFGRLVNTNAGFDGLGISGPRPPGYASFLWSLDPVTGLPLSSSKNRNDLNADGKADILLRHPSSGEVFLWLMK